METNPTERGCRSIEHESEVLTRGPGGGSRERTTVPDREEMKLSGDVCKDNIICSAIPLETE